LSPARQSS